MEPPPGKNAPVKEENGVLDCHHRWVVSNLCSNDCLGAAQGSQTSEIERRKIRSNTYLYECDWFLYKNCMTTKAKGDEHKDTDGVHADTELIVCGP